MRTERVIEVLERIKYFVRAFSHFLDGRAVLDEMDEALGEAVEIVERTMELARKNVTEVKE